MSEDLKGRISKETQRGLNRQKQKMTLKPAMTSGQSKVPSFIVITLNLESLRAKRRINPNSIEVY